MRICLYGASSNEIDKKYIEAAEKLGYEFAKKGHGMVYGAGANGLMGAAARGFTKGGGEIIGVAPEFFNVDGVLYDKCTKLIRTETMRERKRIMEEYADAFVVVPGGIGTFDEFFEILTLKQLGRHNKAIVVYNAYGYYDAMAEMLKNAVDCGFMKEIKGVIYEILNNGADLVKYLENYKSENFDVRKLKNI